MIASADKFKQAQVEAASGRLASGAELTQTDREYHRSVWIRGTTQATQSTNGR